jgi:hypothetical protein
MNTSAWPALLAALAVTSDARGDLTPMDGTQSSTGYVLVEWFPWIEPPVVAEYSLEAPDPLASWSPPDQSITAQHSESFMRVIASIDSTFSSTISPGRVSMSAAATSSVETNVMEMDGIFEYRQKFHFTFSVASPTPVMVSAAMMRLTGWGSTGPFTLTFGPQGGSPLIDLSYPADAPILYSESVGPTFMILEPGIYTVLADANSTSSTNHQGLFKDSMAFDLRVIPSPAGAVPMGAGLLLGLSRRRRERNA